MYRKAFFFLILFLPLVLKSQSEWIQNHLESDFYKNQFTGFYLQDAETAEVLFDYNGEKYFTPASNVKILSLYSAMKVLPDSIPALRYERKNGNLYIEGLGDPTFLHPEFRSVNRAIDFLKNEPGDIYLSWGKFEGTRLGLGWSWEDYEKHYSPERSEFPLYGNMATLRKGKSGPSAFPLTLADSVEYQESLFSRDFYENKFYLGSRNGNSTRIPFVVKDELIRQMLSEAVGKEVFLNDKLLGKNAKVLFSLPSDLVYKRMMEVSDNFLAEQILLMVSAQISGSMSSEKAINYMKTRHLKSMPEDPVWVDGSGLSRYNLFTPRTMVHVLDKLYKEFAEERLFNIFAVGGRTGTLKGNYGGKTPYVYAKSGTLSNNYCLSGYLKTKSGRTLIFSVMNNHFQKQNWQVRQETQKLLEFLRDNY
ncbi:MAG: D-alanyl-D-alanine carboxypeptidase [Flavobacteriaceae bacterium]|jgi:D-alanyl-D-alanine carboxypeptidase/D-alanyl-D-alanine-endopeptidase (penicillin-binding protein 4)|nr:D-alanyl-D-alanine carboxypeptidase [Flavobacteriaceae bacterium]